MIDSKPAAGTVRIPLKTLPSRKASKVRGDTHRVLTRTVEAWDGSQVLSGTIFREVGAGYSFFGRFNFVDIVTEGRAS